MLGLSVDEVLTTTRAVRRRLDLSRPVEPQLIMECLELALQAPTPKSQSWRWVVVTDPHTRTALAELYRTAWDAYCQSPQFVGNTYKGDDPVVRASHERVAASSEYLAHHLEQVPAFVIPCLAARPGDDPTWNGAAAALGSIIQAAWSFMLAARERGLGTCWTTLHLRHDKAAAQILGIPDDRYVQVALIPVAHTVGTDFGTGVRKPLAEVLHWDHWGGAAPV